MEFVRSVAQHIWKSEHMFST